MPRVWTRVRTVSADVRSGQDEVRRVWQTETQATNRSGLGGHVQRKRVL